MEELIMYDKYEDRIRSVVDLNDHNRMINERDKAYGKLVQVMESDYINKNKIIEKAEEYKNMINVLDSKKDASKIKALNERIIALQEILLSSKEE